MKLLIVTTVAATLRGFHLPFSAHFRAKGWKVDALAAGASSCSICAESFDHLWDIEWSRNPRDPRNLLKAPQHLRQIVVEGEYDIVHVHTPIAAFVTRFALRDLRKSHRVRVIYTAHGFHFHPGGRPSTNLAYRALEKLAARWTDDLVVINRTDYEAALRYRLLPPDRVHYMPGIGVDTRLLQPELLSATEVTAIRAELGVEVGAPLYLMVAEFQPNKRHEDMLRAFARLGNGNAHLALAGVGPLLEAMQQLAVDLGIADRVHFLGFRSDIPTLMRASTAMILASQREGLPRSIMEAMCLRVPVIGSDTRGTRDLLQDGRGLLFPVHDVEGLAKSLRAVVDNPADARQMTERAHAFVQQCDIQAILAHHESLYTSRQTRR